MKVNRGRELGKPSVKRTETVTGDMWGDLVVAGDGVVLNSVFFAPGAHSHWHRHEGGQILIVTHGRGYVQTADGDTAQVVAGDVVYCPPGEQHWHGATPDSFVQHTAITLGSTVWLDPVGEEQYDAASRHPSDSHSHGGGSLLN